MKSIGIKIPIIFFLLLLNTLSFSQKSLEPLKTEENSFIEELHTITDRDLYIAGEDVWFKFITLNGIDHIPVNLSKIVYVDLLDMENNPVLQFKASIEGKSGSSQFRLPDTLSTGNYIIRSYTNWMKNFKEDLFSYKMISVINPFKSLNKLNIPEKYVLPDSVIITFEGGQMVSGMETLTGFRSLRRDGRPVKIKGAILNERNDTICAVNTDNEGYGWVRLKSYSGERISLVCIENSGRTKKIPLPEAVNEGITLSVTDNINTPVLVNLQVSSDFLKTGRRIFALTGSAGKDYNRTALKLNSENRSELLKKDLPPGLFNFMIVDESDKIWSSRWIYNEPDQGISFKITTQKTGSAREKIRVEVTASDRNGLPVESDFSISVAKAFTVNKNESGNKLNKLPELASSSSEAGISGINNYLLFYSSDNNQVSLEKSRSVYLPELEGHLISGNMRDRKTGMPLKNENITLSLIGKTALCQFTRTDEKGDFNFVTNEKGVHEIVIQPLSPDIKDCYVELYNPFVTSFIKYNHGLFFIDSSLLDEINNAVISMQIKKIYDPLSNSGSLIKTVEFKPDFYGSPDNQIKMSSYIELTSLKEVVKEIMPGVTTVRKNDKYNFRLINKYQSRSFENNPLVIVDGVPVNDIEKVLDISSKEIERIDVLTTRYFISDIILDGILHFVSKKGDLGVIDFDRSIYRLQYEMPEAKSLFRSPEYSADTLKNSHIPDFRNTLYWNPEVSTGITGKAAVEFYSSDESSEYLIVINGITRDGRTGSAKSSLTINSR